MSQIVKALTRWSTAHPREFRLLLAALLIVCAFWFGESFGEKLGKALFYLTH